MLCVLLASNNTGILNTCTRLCLTESEEATTVDPIKDVVQISVKVPELDKHLKKAGGHIDRNVVERNNKDEENSPKILNDKNQQPSFQKFRQLIRLNSYRNRLTPERKRNTGKDDQQKDHSILKRTPKRNRLQLQTHNVFTDDV